jgi:GT2 family glycosyltransferase
MSEPKSDSGAKPRASIVIANYNGLRYLDKCLEALVAQELDGGFEVLVVDNGSDDASVDHLHQCWPQVRVVEAKKNLGFAAGNTLGLRHSRGEHLVLLNNDTAVRPGWLAALVAAAESHERIGAVTSKLVFMDRPNVIQNAGIVILTDGSGGDRGTGEEDRGQFDEREEVFGACGAAVLYKRAALQDVGFLDSAFFCYYEDTDLSWRLRLKGWRIVFEPEAVVEHVHSGTSGEWSPFFIFHVDRNRLFMIFKNAPLPFVVKSFASFARMGSAEARRMLGRWMRRAEGGIGGPAGGSRARIHLRVGLSLLWHLPEMTVKRWHIRRGRRTSDAEVLGWCYPRELWQAKHAR